MADLPLTFQGTVKYPFNVRSLLGLQPRGFVVLLDFDVALARKGVQEFRLVAQVQAHAPGIANSYLCTGSVDFNHGTLTFESDRPPLRFVGRIDASIPQIEGTINIDIIGKPYDVVFVPCAG